MSLLESDFTVDYRKAILNGNADRVSQIPTVAAVNVGSLEQLV